ncbi:amino acid adenylation domain-containing protein, partial [Gynuella sp.]|uniref:amino acid adenylation domain-containing protein n=1 Tax=Gynuella sp. TaxID=2969146 RepID=UPI003D14269E
AYVPIDPDYPLARRTYMLQDSGVAWLLVEDEQHDLGDLADVTVLALSAADSPAPWLADSPLDNPPRLPEQSAQNRAYVIYTSGSTGQPKGVMVEHHALMNLAHWIHSMAQQHFGDQCQNWALNAPLAFDASLKMVTQLAFGVSLHILPEALRLQPAQLMQYFQQHAIAVADITPSLLEIVLQEAESALQPLPHLLIGGEAVHAQLWDVLSRYGEQHQRVFVNVYGPTEATVDSSYSLITRAQSPNVGYPIDNVQLYVMDTRQQLLPAGYCGELCIAGRGLARGYLNQPALSQEKFPLVTLADGQRVRMYRTGDKVRLREDGRLDYLGRMDNQVKIRGFRIEVGEIDHQLLALEMVTACCTVVRDDAQGNRMLVSYLVPQQMPDVHTDWIQDIRSQLMTRVPHYMIPSAFVLLPQLPVTVNGKVNKQLLPAADLSLQAHYAAPETVMENRLVSIWSDLLAVEASRLSVGQSVFELGAHSLLLLKALAEMKNAGIEATLKAIYEYPAIRDFAAHLQADALSQSEGCVIRLNQCHDGQPLFIFHPFGGRCDGYAALATALENVCPVYGVQAPFTYRHAFSFHQFSQLCDFYIEGLRHYQPKGPYRIAGWSAGGNIAAMVAARLTAAGDDVQNLIVMDALLERQLTSTPKTEFEHLRDVLKIELQDEEDTSSEFALPDVLAQQLDGQHIERQIQMVAEYLVAEQRNDFMDVEQIAIALRFGIDFNAVDRSVPPFAITGKSVLISATKSPGTLQRDIFQSWMKVVRAPANEHYKVDTEHHRMMRDESVRKIAGILRKELRHNRTKHNRTKHAK